MSTHLLFLISCFSFSFLSSFSYLVPFLPSRILSSTLLSSPSYPLTYVFSPLIWFPLISSCSLSFFSLSLLSLTLLFPPLSSCFLSSLFLCSHLISSPLHYFPLIFSHSPCLHSPLPMSSFIDYFLPHFLINLLFVLFPLFLLLRLLLD